MDYIKGYTYGFCTPKGGFLKAEAKESLKLMKEGTNASHVIFALAALQETPQSIEIDYKGSHMVSDEELIEMINYAKSLDLRIILKPLVNVANGTWRAHINFFDVDVPCEPKWHEWFSSYTAYQEHYGKIAQATGCEMLIVGCEMVQSDRRSDQWRQLIKDVRVHYKGLITYNADKYQEDQITWWDAVDVISASGYYPIDDWDQQLQRIKKVVDRYKKPFFFAEAGCMSRLGSDLIPNDWTKCGDIDMMTQAKYYEKMFEKVGATPWVQGFGLWDWDTFLYDSKEADSDGGYGTYNKPAEKVIKSFYSR